MIEFKFGQNPALCRFLAHVTLSSRFATQLIAQADVVVPVPLSDMRLRERGFNQSALLAHQLAANLVNEHILSRLRHTTPQSELGREARLNNLWHSIAVNPSGLKTLSNRRVLLIDDVMTTGSTLSVCAQALLSAGAKQVNCLVFARA